MSRKEDFKKAADDYVEGEPDGAQKIVGQVGFEFGAEYGYQYAQTHPNWISVDKMLPEKGKDVLVWSSGSNEPMAGYYWHWNWQRKQHMFYVYNDRNMWGNITHWMPIVPPRKEDKE